MKKLRFCFLLLFAGVAPALAPQNATAQDLQVRVSSDGVRVGYAYVFINEAFHAMADSTGTTRIPAGRLQRGDILSARFVGMESVPFVYEGNAPGDSVIPLELIPDTIDEVMVTARDPSMRLFRKYVKKIPMSNWYNKFRGDYYVRFYNNRTVQGKFDYILVPPKYADYWKIDTFTLQPASDTTGLFRNIARIYLIAHWTSFNAASLNDWYASTKEMIIRYRGRDKGRHVFLLVKPYFDKFSGVGESFQTLIYVDPDSGQVVSSETISQTQYGIWNVSADYAIRGMGKKSRVNEFLYATRMEGSFEGSDVEGNNISNDFVMDNVSVDHFSLGPIPKKDRKEVGNIYLAE